MHSISIQFKSVINRRSSAPLVRSKRGKTRKLFHPTGGSAEPFMGLSRRRLIALRLLERAAEVVFRQLRAHQPNLARCPAPANNNAYPNCKLIAIRTNVAPPISAKALRILGALLTVFETVAPNQATAMSDGIAVSGTRIPSTIKWS